MRTWDKLPLCPPDKCALGVADLVQTTKLSRLGIRVPPAFRDATLVPQLKQCSGSTTQGDVREDGCTEGIFMPS